VLKILGDQNRVIENFIRDSDTVVAELEARKDEVSRFIVEAGETAEISATRREELRQTFNKLPGFLGELTPTMARLEDLADEQIPLLRDARRAAPDLDAFLKLLKRDGTMTLVGAPATAHPSPGVFNLIFKRRSLAGSMIGGIPETQEMLDFCAEHAITADVEMIAAAQINQAYERMLKGDVKYRFVIDNSTLSAGPSA
jgi:D-arabinose 1-dehydrogenase-like Zn-dependent alcohol dehydrogenase